MKKEKKSNFIKATAFILTITCSLLFTNIANSQFEEVEKAQDTYNTWLYIGLAATVLTGVVYFIVQANSKNSRREERKAEEEKKNNQTDSSSVNKTDSTSAIKTDSSKVKQKENDK